MARVKQASLGHRAYPKLRSGLYSMSVLVLLVLQSCERAAASSSPQELAAVAGKSDVPFELHMSSIPVKEDVTDGHKSRWHARFKRNIADAVYEPVRKANCSYDRLMMTEDGKPVPAIHTGCLEPNPRCDIYNSEVTTEEKMQIIKIHNDLRSKVAMGHEHAGSPGPQPPAILMNELTWDDELEALARDWATQCIDAQGIGDPMPRNPHDCTDCRKVLNHNWPFVGQNVAWSATWSSDGSLQLQSQWPKHIHGWYDEVKDFSRDEAAHFKGDQPGQPMIAHYTQVVWGSTSKIGCGAAYYNCNIRNAKDMNIYRGQCLKYVCNYGSGGNIRGMKVYEQPCAEPSAYPGLCKLDIKPSTS